MNDLFGHTHLKSSLKTTTTALAEMITEAIRRIECRLGHGRGATELEIVEEGQLMCAEGLHNFKLGRDSNIRNCIQRHCSDYKAHQSSGNADIFRTIRGSKPPRWTLRGEK